MHLSLGVTVLLRELVVTSNFLLTLAYLFCKCKKTYLGYIHIAPSLRDAMMWFRGKEMPIPSYKIYIPKLSEKLKGILDHVHSIGRLCTDISYQNYQPDKRAHIWNLNHYHEPKSLTFLKHILYLSAQWQCPLRDQHISCQLFWNTNASLL